MSPKIRSAASGDGAAIAHVYVETWRDAYPGMLPDKVLVGLSKPRHETFWHQQIEKPESIVIVADDPDAGIVGFGSAGYARDPSLAHDGEVYTLYLLPDWRNRGTGRALLVGLFDALSANGCRSVLVWVLAHNPSRFFYETMGGSVVSEKVEKLWGASVHQFAYGWASLAEAIVK
tara:strand:- start:112 stop:636 length:525 start_codon:yes stop_codon:yes gene_type:complete